MVAYGKRRWTAFVGRFSTALRELKETDAYRVIHERYFGLATE
jgi:hypothetical protein